MLEFPNPWNSYEDDEDTGLYVATFTYVARQRTHTRHRHTDNTKTQTDPSRIQGLN